MKLHVACLCLLLLAIWTAPAYIPGETFGMLKHGGPHSFRPTLIGENMWIFYSITKEQIGVTKVPLANL